MKTNSKLVRDKIPEIISQQGSSPITHIASDKEYWDRLKEKLKEEVFEFHQSENEEELADILEVIDSICDFKSINKKKLEQLRRNKARKKGRFKDKIVLDDVRFQDI